MPCYHPMDGFRSKMVGPSGKRGITFNPSEGYRDLPIQVPCGQCIGCRLEKSRQWALRCEHEASLHMDNSFLTLTYNNENLPLNNSLNLRHFQLFIKKLRKKYNTKIRYYHCGEYGEENQRPHYHALLFNFDFKDKIHYKTHNGNKYYQSEELSQLWGHGYCVIGDLTFESAAYVARYCLKKFVGKDSLKYYLRSRIDWETGEEIHEYVEKEYATMSRRPGIGQGWWKKFQSDPGDFIIRKGVKMRPPKFYDRQLEEIDPKKMRSIKIDRKINAAKHSEDNTRPRLADREKVQQAQAKRLIRGMENE